MTMIFCCALSTVTLGTLSVLAFAGVSFANEQRECSTSFAVFPSGHQEDATFRLTIAASAKAAKIRVKKSGEWTGKRTRHSSGADTIVFNTAAAVETLTIGVQGALLWEIDYRDDEANSDRVMAFIGTCDPWRQQ